MKLTFAFSPCPNDTFMFEAIVNKRIDLEGLDFEIIMEDVEYLNKAAINHRYDISKLSFNAFSKLTDSYQLLTSGSALGNNCGPLLVTKSNIPFDQLVDKKIAIPGINTTAYMLLKHAFPHISNVKEMMFSDIEHAINSGEVDAGLLIHENRFTYEQKGLVKILDLGEYWESKTGSPIPLGGIAIKSYLDDTIKSKVNRILKSSIEYAFSHPKSGLEFIKKHAQEMDEKIMYSHIDLYVNQYSKSLGPEGKKAILALFQNNEVSLSKSEFEHIFVE